MLGHHNRDSTGNNGKNGKQKIAPGSGRCHWTGRRADLRADPKVLVLAKAKVLGRGKAKAKARAKVGEI